MVSKRHDAYAKGMTQKTVGPSMQVHREVALPISATAVDLMMEFDEVPGPYALFTEELRQRSVYMEFYSTPPSFDEIVSCIHKINEGLRLQMKLPNRPKRTPALLILSTGTPVAALKLGAEFAMFEPTAHAHIYHTRGMPGADVWLVDTTRIRGPRTIALRLLSSLDYVDKASVELLKALREAEEFDTLTRGEVMEYLMNTAEQEEMNELRDLTARELREWALTQGEFRGHQRGIQEGRREGRSEGRREGRSEGRSEGLRQGLSEGREALLAVARRLLPADASAGLDAIMDLKALELEIFRRLDG